MYYTQGEIHTKRRTKNFPMKYNVAFFVLKGQLQNKIIWLDVVALKREKKRQRKEHLLVLNNEVIKELFSQVTVETDNNRSDDATSDDYG